MSRMDEMTPEEFKRASKKRPSLREDEAVWDRFPTLDAYRRRIGAEVKNFRRAVVYEQAGFGYSRIVATITIKDGKLSCSSVELAPTAPELQQIEAELLGANFPSSCPSIGKALPEELASVDPKHLLIYLDESGSNIVFIQWRRNGEKPDLPYSYWSDGKWRNMQPDGPLPLYGLEKLRKAAAVMLHEGGKAARDVTESVKRNEAHPWKDGIRQVEHIGWPGGATNPEGVDWAPLKALAPNVHVYMVCDNDQLGVEAATRVSAILRRSMSVIRFDRRFPSGFDLADKFPDGPDFYRDGHYIGPSMQDCIDPATWATQIVPTGGRGRPSYEVRDQFANEWYYTADPHMIVHRSGRGGLMTEDVFNRLVRPYSHVDSTARLLRMHAASQCHGLTYKPGVAESVAIIDGRRLLNTYQPPRVVPKEGNVEPFLEYMKHLIPDEEDRTAMMRWCATLVARPDIRMKYGVLLISEEQGVGKSTLAQILARLVGETNVSYPDEKQVTDSNFNSWVARKRLAIVNEIYAGHSKKPYDRLKSIITDKSIDVNEKYQTAYTLDNCIHIFACSNSMRALHISDGDRRWLIPRVTEQKQPKEYWEGLHAWLGSGGYEAIAHWAKNWVAEHGPVSEGDHAPMTSVKQEIIEDSRSEGARMAFELGQRMLTIKANEKIVVSVSEVRAYIAEQRKLDQTDRRMETARTIRKALKDAGFKSPLKGANEKRSRYQIGSVKSEVLANFDIASGTPWPELKAYHLAPNGYEPEF